VLQKIPTPPCAEPTTVQSPMHDWRQPHEIADVPQVLLTHSAKIAPPARTTQIWPAAHVIADGFGRVTLYEDEDLRGRLDGEGLLEPLDRGRAVVLLFGLLGLFEPLAGEGELALALGERRLPDRARAREEAERRQPGSRLPGESIGRLVHEGAAHRAGAYPIRRDAFACGHRRHLGGDVGTHHSKRDIERVARAVSP